MARSTLCEEYAEQHRHYRKLYGNKTCILMQVGSFYELQAVDGDAMCLQDVAQVLNIQVTKKNKKEETSNDNPHFAGFPKHAATKYLPVLLQNGFTVVLIDETDKKSNNKIIRSVAGIYSPSIYPVDMLDAQQAGNGALVSITAECHSDIRTKKQKVLFYSTCWVNMGTNTFNMYENSQAGTDVKTLMQAMMEDIQTNWVTPTEILIKIIDTTVEDTSKTLLSKSAFIDYMDGDTAVHYSSVTREEHDMYMRAGYQNERLKTVYNHIDFGLLQPLEYFSLERNSLSVCNGLYAIDFIGRHDKKYLEQLGVPVLTEQTNYLNLELNTPQQLNLLPHNQHNNKNIRFSSLFDVVDKTSTTIGKRALKQLLCRPFKDVDTLQRRYTASESFESNCDINQVESFLQKVCDIDRLHRKMSLKVLHPYEFYNLHTSYINIMRIRDVLQATRCLHLNEVCYSEDVHSGLSDLMNEYEKCFEIEEMRRYSLNDNASTIRTFFKPGIQVIDKINNDITSVEARLEDLRNVFVSKIKNSDDWFKMSYTDQEGYHITCTKVRMQALKKKLTSEECEKLEIKSNSTVCRFSTREMTDLSNKLRNLRDIFEKRIKQTYTNYLETWHSRYVTVFTQLRTFVERIDIIKSNIKCKQMYKYCQPEIVSSEESFIEATEMRHPIIERLETGVAYVPNDISLNKDKTGMVLYALNSCGKSSLLRSVGLCVVLAQSGLYVPCSSFKFSPFDAIITQVDFQDNLWKSQSSFISEMLGLKRILSLANAKTLVLSDELTKGTEVVSATSIFATAVKHLLQKKCKFIFTTHLQDVAKLEDIKSCDQLRICHLSVQIQGDEIIFERKIQDGPSSELYGLEVAKAVGLGNDFIDEAFNIRNHLVNNKKQSIGRKSRYNAKKILIKCEVCGYAPKSKTDMPLDTHHIKFQCHADNEDFTGHFHKNDTCNLVCLCKSCHIKVHGNLINILGYKSSTKGVTLDVTLS